jgi:predicted ABC-type ATPase
MVEKKDEKELIIIGGPNGSGKTTLATELLKENGYEYLSADEIAYELNSQKPLSVRLKAGKEFFKRLNDFGKREKNLMIESTLAGKSLLGKIEQFKDWDYRVSIMFTFLNNEEICMERIQTRVRKGGHLVPRKDVKRRFGRSIANFWNDYRNVSDRWILYYNDEEAFQEVANRQEGEINVYNEPLFTIFKKMTNYYGKR